MQSGRQCKWCRKRPTRWSPGLFVHRVPRMSGGTEVSAPDPWWTWPSRVLGVLLIVVGLVGPVAWLYRRNVAAVPKQRVLAAASAPKQSERPMLRPKMLHLPPGDFRMGSPDGADDEKPVRIVHLTKGFALSETEVTQAQYQAVMGNNPSRFKDKPDSGQRSVEQVSWFDAVKLLQPPVGAGRSKALLYAPGRAGRLARCRMSWLSLADRGRVGIRSARGSALSVCWFRRTGSGGLAQR